MAAVGAAEQTEAKAAARRVKVVDFIFGLEWTVEDIVSE